MEILKEHILKIIEAGNLAPSGSNSQPWKFIIKNNLLQIIALPEKEHPIFNFRNRGTYIAHGALLENIIIASSKFGYKTNIKIFPYADNQNITAEILFDPTQPQEHELYEAIFQRCSNRKPFETKKIEENIKNYLFENNFSNCKLSIIEDDSKIEQASKLLALDVILNLQNRTLHQLFFKEIIWKEQEQKYRGGLYVKTMEIPGPAIFILKMLSYWKINNIFRKIHSKIYEENKKTIKSTGLIGAILTSDNDKNFLEVGRLMQSIWLKATKKNLNFHLITGMLFLWQQANFGHKEIFTDKEINLINETYHNLKNIFDVKEELIAVTFRIGYGHKPSAISYKRDPIIEYL